MFKTLRNTILTLVSAVTLMAVPVAVPAVAGAQSTTQKCLNQGSNLDVSNIGSSCGGTSTTSGSTSKINDLVKLIVNIFSLIVGIVAVVMIIVGGLRYITSGGDSNNVSSAKNTIIYAIIGLVIVALAQFIVQFVLNKVTSGS